MAKKERSSAYPIFDLQTAIEKITTLYKSEGKNYISRNAAVVALGYKTKNLSGPAAQSISTLSQYGLLDKDRGNVKISGNGLVIILESEDSEQRKNAILKASKMPPIFGEIFEKYAESLPSDNTLKSWLIREKKYTESAVGKLIDSLRKTVNFSDQIGKRYSMDNNSCSTNNDSYGPEISQNQTKQNKGEWARTFTWPLSDATTATLNIYGSKPGRDELDLLSDYVKMAQKALSFRREDEEDNNIQTMEQEAKMK